MLHLGGPERAEFLGLGPPTRELLRLGVGCRIEQK